MNLKYVPGEQVVERLNNDFTYHRPFGDQAERYEEIRLQGKMIAIILVSLCPPSRELSMALSHIDEAVMCANAAIARNEKEESAAPDVSNTH